jgi:hypothetical protein
MCSGRVDNERAEATGVMARTRRPGGEKGKGSSIVQRRSLQRDAGGRTAESVKAVLSVLGKRK